MKRTWLAVALPLLLLSAAFAATVSVVVVETQVRKRPQFYAPAVATVHLGDQLETQGLQDGWYKVDYQGTAGWVHQSALSGKKARVSSGKWQGSEGASADEVTLAGKGFNDSVEQSYRSSHGGLNYAAVEAMEARTVGDEQLAGFLSEGGLIPQGGGR